MFVKDFFLKKWMDKVGTSGFEPPISRPPDAHFNRTKLRPDSEAKVKSINVII